MKMKKLRSANSFDKPECAFEDDANDDFETMETACSHCLRKAQLAQLRALNGNDSKIRMSGYLKKKRNSITGGWRKLYFVLRNRFLLSYRSRDIYEPVKDVIRLHKRMAILPRAGLRFEIMDNGYVLYSLRCDSQQTFSEWIAVLLNSFVNANGEANYERKL
ncbi:uncharacterized protein LOC131214560, partial [Anopheles bellator]|uniref:uncharacterized protein LOC131214560 n=1 Tax=Anopheles bellator TaxID=139047 RepID=UPI002647CAB8